MRADGTARAGAVLHVVTRMNVGGPARHLVWLVRELRRSGVEAHLVTGSVAGNEADMTRLAVEAGLTPLLVPALGRAAGMADIIALVQLFVLFVRLRPALIHSHTTKAGALARVAALLYRIATPTIFLGRPRPCKVVHTHHGHHFAGFYPRLVGWAFAALERALAVVTDRFIVLSEGQRHDVCTRFRAAPRDRVDVVPIACDLPRRGSELGRRDATRLALNIEPGAIAIGIVGRLAPVKNHALFLAAAAGVERVAPRRAHFVVVGCGELLPTLEALGRQLGIAARLTFAGYRDDMEQVYEALDIVALASLSEGTPLAVLEALAHRRPVVATAVGGVPELIGGVVERADDYQVCERGLLVASGDHCGFAAALLRLMGSTELGVRLANAGPAYLRARHAPEQVLDGHLLLYRKLGVTDGALGGRARRHGDPGTVTVDVHDAPTAA